MILIEESAISFSAYPMAATDASRVKRKRTAGREILDVLPRKAATIGQVEKAAESSQGLVDCKRLDKDNSESSFNIKNAKR